MRGWFDYFSDVCQTYPISATLATLATVTAGLYVFDRLVFKR